MMFWISALFLLVYALIIYYLKNQIPKLESQEMPPSRDKSFSIIIAMRNESAQLDFLLSQLNKIDYPKNKWEVLLVDDHSEDDSVAFVQNYKKNFSIKILENTGEGKKDALNTGIENAQYDQLLLTDADCALPAQILQYYSGAYQNAEVILGPVQLEGKGRLFDYFQEVDFAMMQIWTATSLVSGKLFLANGANLSYKKQAFLEAGGFENKKTPSGDDILFLQQIPDSKMQFAWLQDCIVKTFTQSTFRDFFQQRLRWASKTSYYKNTYARVMSLFLFLLNVLLFVDMCLLTTSYMDAEHFVFLILGKFILETALLFPALKFFSMPKDYLKLILFQIPHIIYMTFLGILSQFLAYSWKGRKYS